MNWLKIEIVEGLQKLIALRLRNSPPADMITATVSVWFETISTRPIAWNERLDRKRIKTAFTELCATCDTFPAPSQFVRLLPQREQPLSLPAPVDNKITQQNKKLLDDLMRKLKKT
jgi:hypothetical protein